MTRHGDEIVVTFSGRKHVDARVGDRTIRTDQSLEHGGEASAPEPFDLFLASLAACAGTYVLAFCQTRSIPTEGMQLSQRATYDGPRLVGVAIDIALPRDFPPEYFDAIRAAAAACKVHKVLQAPPEIEITAQRHRSQS